jgi:hypothetical protein
VHNNHYFLRQLCTELQREITGFTLVSCFSQNKDELILELNNEKKSFFIKASLLPALQCLSFPTGYRRARKNSVDLFHHLLMSKVTGIHAFSNERSLGLLLGIGNTLVFKMHGTQSNVIWFKDGAVQEIFRNNFPSDLELLQDQLERTIDWSFENFQTHHADLHALYFTFRKTIWQKLEEQHFNALGPADQWKLITNMRSYLEKPAYCLNEKEGVVSLSLFSSKDNLACGPAFDLEPLHADAATELARAFEQALG